MASSATRRTRPGGAMPRGLALMLAVLSLLWQATAALTNELVFSPPRTLPGDLAIVASAGMQEKADIARGGDRYLAVWSDGRATPDNYYPFATEGSGTDIYAILLDAGGNPIGDGPIVVDQTYGDQTEPRVAWNGQNWIVIFESPRTSEYDGELRVVRVSPGGAVLDTPAIVIDTAGYQYLGSFDVAGGNGEWVAIVQDEGFYAFRIAGDGTVLNPGGLLVHSPQTLLRFDIAFAQDEYMIVLEGGQTDYPRALRYTTDLQPLGTTALPFAQRIATDGTDFLVAAARGSAPLATVDAMLVTHDGAAEPPFTIYSPGGQAGTCCVGVTWDGSHYWVSWGGPRLARVTADGQLLDPGGIPVTPPEGRIALPEYESAAGGGMHVAYNHSYSGAHDPKDIYLAPISPAGALGSPALLSTGASAQLEADFAEGDGVHLIVFIARESEGGRILAQRIDADGAALDPEPVELASGPIPGPGNGLPSLGAPAAAWNGSLFMITWSDGLQIYARRMLPDGSLLDPLPLTVMDGHSPDVAAVGQVFLVVGLDYLFGNPQWQATHSMRVDGATGENLDPEPNALGGFAIFARYPHVVSWGDRWLAVWQRNRSHNDPVAGTTAAIVLADGTTPGLIDVPLGWRPDADVSGDRALIAAVTNSVASATTDLAGVVMLPDGTFLGSDFLISAAFDKQLRPAVAWNGSEFIVVWEDKRNSAVYFDERTDIYGSRITPEGAVLDPAGVAIAATPVPEIVPALQSIGGTTLLAVSTFHAESEYGAYRIDIHSHPYSPTGISELPGTPLAGLRLLGAHPNPANPSATIVFEYGGDAPVSVRILDIGGRLVRTLLDRRILEERARPHSVHWDGRDDAGRSLGSGVFLYEVSTPEGSASGKLALLK